MQYLGYQQPAGFVPRLRFSRRFHFYGSKRDLHDHGLIMAKINEYIYEVRIYTESSRDTECNSVEYIV